MNRRILGAAVLAAGAGVSLASAATLAPAAKMGEIRVFVLDKSGKVPDLAKATASVTLTPKAEKPEVIRLSIHRPATSRGIGVIPASAEVKDSGNYRVGVELFVPKAKEEKGAKTEGKEKSDPKSEAEKTHEMEPMIAFFKAPVSLEEYACAKCKGTPSAGPGKCAKCGGELVERVREFDVALSVQIGDENLNVTGIHLKAGAMATPAAGVKPKGD